METPTSFGQRLKQWRKALDLTQADLARCVGCSTVTIQKIEADERRPSRQMAELIAQCLDIHPEDRPTFLKVARAELRIERLGEISVLSTISPESWHASSSPASNLPAPPTPLLGRELELEAIARLLNNPQCQLLTLVGPGGIGKTHLALEAAAHQHQAFGDGVYFVSLAPLSSAEFIVPTIADAIGFTFYGPEAPKTQLLGYLRKKQMLLLLDNFEHLLSPPLSFPESETRGGDEGGDTLVADILQRAPGVKLLVTSRERLNLQGEWLLEIEGLPYPEDLPPAEAEIDTISLTHFPAVTLFIDSGQRVRPGFQLTKDNQVEIGRICRLMEGMPLGIKLAASWVRVLSCREIAQEIERNLDFLTTSARDVPARLRSLRAAFNHSWSLLGEDERQVLRRLSVFRGGFWREAAEQVAGATLPILSSLVDKSLLHRAATGRYTLHFLIRQYAAAHLADEPQAYKETRNRHCSYYTALLQQHEVPLKGARQKESAAKLGPETDNMRLAWTWAVDQGKITEIRQAVYGLWRFYYARNWYKEGEAIFRYATEKLQIYCSSEAPATNHAEATIALGQVLAKQGWFCFHQGQHGQARELLSQSLALVRPLNDPAALADVLLFLGVVTMLMGDYQEAVQYIDESLAISRAFGDQWITALCLSNLGMIAHMLGDYPEAYRLFRESLEEWRVVGDPYLTAFCLNFFGSVANVLGQYAEAEDLIGEGLAIAQANEDRWGIATALNHLGLVVQAQGEARRAEAQDLFGESIAGFKELGDHWSLARALNNMGLVTAELGDYSEAQHYFCDAIQMAMEAHIIPIVLDALVGIAGVLATQDRAAAEQALEVLTQVLHHAASSQETKGRAERLRAELEARLSSQQIETIRARAQARTFEAVVQELLGDKTRDEAAVSQQ